MKIYEQSEGDPIVPRLLSYPLGVSYSISPDKQEIIVALIDDIKEKPLVGYRMKTELFLKTTHQAIKLLISLGYKVWNTHI